MSSMKFFCTDCPHYIPNNGYGQELCGVGENFVILNDEPKPFVTIPPLNCPHRAQLYE
ncbi:MAG: hypothetical protein IKD04_08975 [Clostridia bacterium]|nr:hypothetical protein [Clostridia bacterium]